MSETTQTLSSLTASLSTDNVVFSGDTRSAVMNVISTAEARSQFGKAGMTSQGAGALFRNILGSIGIELGGSQAEYAAHLVQLRVIAAAANDPQFVSLKTGTQN